MNPDERVSILGQRAQRCATELSAHPLIARLAAVEDITPAQLLTIIKERHRFGATFEPALEAALRISQSRNYAILTEMLQRNWNDEIGVGPDGHMCVELAHKTWRRDHLNAFGITDVMLKEGPLTQATEGRFAAVARAISRRSLTFLCGVLLYDERTIPPEYRAIQAARNELFADMFVDMPRDSDAIRAQKERARMFIDDHISHDPRHYSELRDGLEDFIRTRILPTFTMSYVITGIDKAHELKMALYDELLANL